MQNQFLPTENAAETTLYVAPFVTSETVETPQTIVATQAVPDRLAETQGKERAPNRGAQAGIALLEVMLIAPFIWSALHHGYWPPYLKPYSTLFRLLSLYLPLCVLFALLLNRYYHNTDTLENQDNIKAIPSLLESVVGNTTSQSNSAIRALMVLLPQMRATDAALLTSRHRRRLSAFLRQIFFEAWMNGADYSFAVAILKAYEQVGDAKAIPVVARLAKSHPRSEGQRKIQQAAAECLPLLRANASGIETTQTLLRASMPETNTPDTLLRAATVSVTTPNDELLRTTIPHDLPPSV